VKSELQAEYSIDRFENADLFNDRPRAKAA